MNEGKVSGWCVLHEVGVKQARIIGYTGPQSATPPDQFGNPSKHRGDENPPKTGTKCLYEVENYRGTGRAHEEPEGAADYYLRVEIENRTMKTMQIHSVGV